MYSNRSNYNTVGKIKYEFINKMASKEDLLESIEMTSPNYISYDDDEQINQEGILKSYMTPQFNILTSSNRQTSCEITTDDHNPHSYRMGFHRPKNSSLIHDCYINMD